MTAAIQIFLGSTPESHDRLEALRALLSEEECARVDRIRLEHVRRRQLAALGGLRIVLGRTLGTRPEAVRFARGPHGKPHLEDEALSFNLSRSGDRFAVGVARSGALGVDIEFERPIPRLTELARTVFSDMEMNELSGGAEEERLGAFYRGWTRKEAFIKAVGTGLHLPLRSFSVRLGPAGGNALLDLDERALSAAGKAGGADAEWWVGSFRNGLPSDLYGAVAWDGGEPSLDVGSFEWE